MTETRRDATDTSGAMAVQRVHCDGPLLLDGGPCLCDADRACWLVVLPCNCDCPGAVRVVRLDAAADAVWPFEDRVAGRVIETPDGCFVYMGSTSERPPNAGEIPAGTIIAVHESCDAAPCTDPPCPDQGGFAFTLGSCVGQRQVSCLARIRVTYRLSGYYLDTEEFSGGQFVDRRYISVTGEYEYTGGSEPERWSFDTRLRGIRDETAAGGSLSEWDVTQSVDQDSPGPGSVGYAPTIAGFFGIGAAYQPETGLTQNAVGFDLAGFPDTTGLCDNRIEWDGDPNAVPTGYAENQSRITPTQAFSATGGRVQWPGENTIRVGFFTSIEVREIELVDGTVIEFEDCDEPMPSIAMACDADAEPQEITYDAQLLTGLGRTIIDIETDQLYIPTTLPSDGEAIAFVENPDGCPDPEPTGEIFRINRCNSTIQATGGEVVGDTVQPRTIGYRVGDGMNPGEGFVYYPGVAENACLFRIPGQPTTEVLEEEPDIVLTSQPGVCSSQPVARIDPRPQCQQQDGGGGVGPSDNQALVDPSTARAFAGQMKNYNCDSCG